MSSCHAAYLPYWFARRRREVVEVSFPGKLAVYAAARTPVLFHGPSYSSPVRFLERFRMGRVCATLDPAAIQSSLAAIIRDAPWRAGAEVLHQRHRRLRQCLERVAGTVERNSRACSRT